MPSRLKAIQPRCHPERSAGSAARSRRTSNYSFERLPPSRIARGPSTAWGQGLATEGTRRLLDLALAEHGLPYVMGTTLKANIGSWRVMEKAGMKFEKSFTYPEDLAPHWNNQERAAVKYSLPA